VDRRRSQGPDPASSRYSIVTVSLHVIAWNGLVRVSTPKTRAGPGLHPATSVASDDGTDAWLIVALGLAALGAAGGAAGIAHRRAAVRARSPEVTTRTLHPP
jgi:hypothetical protein